MQPKKREKVCSARQDKLLQRSADENWKSHTELHHPAGKTCHTLLVKNWINHGEVTFCEAQAQRRREA
jgi:hypothetical protein